MKNNLFSYATSELSQDAFICYLASFALDRIEGKAALKKCAKQFLHLLVPEIDPSHATLQSIERQAGQKSQAGKKGKADKIDVLLTVKYDATIYRIIIEDKIFSDEHDDQLTRYRNDESLQGENVKICGVYYKTGFQGDTFKIKAAQYRIITREMMLDFLKPYIPNISNQIVQEYYEYWASFQADSEKFKTLPLAKWGWKQIYGFYDDLKLRLIEQEIQKDYPNFWARYGNVPNAAGGFAGCWMGQEHNIVNICGSSLEIYLQYQIYSKEKENTAAELCLKIARKDQSTANFSKAKNWIVCDDGKEYRLGKYHFSRPKRISWGKTITVGKYCAKLDTYEQLILAAKSAIVDYERLMKDIG